MNAPATSLDEVDALFDALLEALADMEGVTLPLHHHFLAHQCTQGEPDEILEEPRVIAAPEVPVDNIASGLSQSNLEEFAVGDPISDAASDWSRKDDKGAAAAEVIVVEDADTVVYAAMEANVVAHEDAQAAVTDSNHDEGVRAAILQPLSVQESTLLDTIGALLEWQRLPVNQQPPHIPSETKS